MGFHDRIAARAIADGHSSSKFSQSAQRFANSTWIWGLISGAVWYFSDWQLAILPAAIGTYSAVKSVSATMIAHRIEKIELAEPNFVNIVRDYGAYLEANALPPGVVADARNLPHPKEKIDEALIFLLNKTHDRSTVEFLKIGYILLSQWQDGVGPKKIGLDISEVDLNKDTKDLASEIVEISELYEKWRDIVNSEIKIREEKIKNMMQKN